MNALLLDGELALVGALVLDTIFEFFAQLSFGDARAAQLVREQLGLEERGHLDREEAVGWRGGGEVQAERGGRQLHRRGFDATSRLCEAGPESADDRAKQPQRERGSGVFDGRGGDEA